MTILLTGFEPFGGSDRNPSEQIARTLDGHTAGGQRVQSVILPVDCNNGPFVLQKSIERTVPSAVICLGQNSGIGHIALERVAVNLLDYRIPDNAGNQVIDQPVISGGPAAYFTTLPVRSMQAAIQAAGVPVFLSMSAGTFLCNQIMYILLHHLAKNAPFVPGGFIHLPALPEQAALETRAAPSMAFETSLRAVQAALQVVAKGIEGSL